MQKEQIGMSKIAENYCQMFPNGSATRDLLSGFQSGGHFCEALRKGDVSEMINRADFKNSMFLYILSHECILGFSPTHDDMRILRSHAIQYAKESKMKDF